MSSFLIHRFRKLETIGPLTLQLKGGGIAELCSEVKNMIALTHQVDNHSIQTEYPIHYITPFSATKCPHEWPSTIKTYLQQQHPTLIKKKLNPIPLLPPTLKRNVLMSYKYIPTDSGHIWHLGT